MWHALVTALRARGVDVQTALDAGMIACTDEDHLASLLLDSRVLADQQLNERSKQRFAALANVVHKLEEPQIEWEFLLGYAPMRAQPTPQERPEAFHGVHVHLTKADSPGFSGKVPGY